MQPKYVLRNVDFEHYLNKLNKRVNKCLVALFIFKNITNFQQIVYK